MTSWWTDPSAQKDYDRFRSLAATQWPRMSRDPEANRVSPLTGLSGSTKRGTTMPAANASGEVAA